MATTRDVLFGLYDMGIEALPAGVEVDGPSLGWQVSTWRSSRRRG